MILISSARMRVRILLFGAAAYLTVTNLVWIAYDTRPPFWDMARHLSAAIGIHEAARDSLPAAARAILGGITGYYPPLYQSIMAVFYGTFGETVDAALWANIPAVLLLLVATYGIGRTVLSQIGAASAAVIVNFYPLMLWLSREAMMEYWLTSMVALAVWLLVTGSLETWSRTLLFGLVCGLGMLTKWTFPFFVGLPFLWFARGRIRNAAASVGIAALVSASWYGVQIPTILELLEVNTAGGVGEGDPSRLSFQAVIFYVRALEGYQLFLPLFLAFLAGALLLARRFDPAWTPVLLWILSGWLGLMLFQNKDPRYSVPLLPAVALVTARVFDKRPILLALLLPFLVFQHYLVSFGIRGLPERMVLAEGTTGPVSYDWHVYTQIYFGLWGPPAREDWKIERVLDQVASSGGNTRLAIVPDIARFDPRAFELYVTLRQEPVTIHSLWVLDELEIAGYDYILVTEGSYGKPGSFLFSPDRERIAEYLEERPDAFRVIDAFELPSGEMIRLYQVNA